MFFKLPYQPYGCGETERVVEIPWALSCIDIKHDEKILDVGYAYAEDRYLNELTGLGIKELHGVDYVLNEVKSPKIIKKQADLRTMTCYPDNYFDLILAISVIEHIGHDNGIYFKEENFIKDSDGDLKALKNLVKALKIGGKIVLTVPYGKKADYGWFLHYDRESLNKLIKFPGLRLLKEDLFIYKNGGWNYSNDEDLAGVEYKSNTAPAAAGLACILLQKE